MRRRLLVIVLALVAGLIVALGVPLERTFAERALQTSYIGRVEDTSTFADNAASALVSGSFERLQATAERYDRLYDSGVLVVDTEEKWVVTSPRIDRIDRKTPEIHAALRLALADRPAQQPDVVWPWDDRPLVVAEAVKSGNQVLGAALIVSPTDRTRAAVADHLVLVALGCLAALLVLVAAVAAPVVRWVLRPVEDLDRATHEITLGRLKTRVSEREGAPELRRLANSFNAMADSMHASQEQQRAFVAQASHQLRNPLTALRLRVENLEEYIADPQGLSELHYAAEEADRFGEMLDGLLRLARAEASEAERAPVDVSAVVGHRLDAWRAAYARAGVELAAEVPDGVGALCLPDCLDHALDTLLDNALKFGRGAPVAVTVVRLPGGEPRRRQGALVPGGEGGRQGSGDTDGTGGTGGPGGVVSPGMGSVGGSGGRAETEEDGPGGRLGLADGRAGAVVEVTVRDQGPGLTPEELAQAGGRFWRSPRHQNVPGTGLGLALTRTVVEAGGGELFLAPGAPTGLAATIRLPAAPAPGPAVTPRAATGAKPGAKSGAKG